jgi:hypothetical protein
VFGTLKLSCDEENQGHQKYCVITVLDSHKLPDDRWMTLTKVLSKQTYEKWWPIPYGIDGQKNMRLRLTVK